MSVVPILWLLIFIARVVFKDRDQQAQRQPAAPRPAGGVPASRLTFGSMLHAALFFFLVNVPLGFLCLSALIDRPGAESLMLVTCFLCLGLPFPFPHWLAWRVLAPLGWVKAARWSLRAACFVDAEDRQGAIQLLEAVYGQGGQGWRPGPGKVTLWTIFAMAAQAEREEDPARAELILEGVRRLPSIPYGTLRSRGVELLAWPAVRRGDWGNAFFRLEPGRGRGARLLRLLTEAHHPLGKTPSPMALWLAWLLAPGRRRSFPYLRAALAARRGKPAVRPAPEPVKEPGSPWLRHLRLLDRAASGGRVLTAELESLAKSWEGALGRSGYARVLARGLELGVQGVAETAEALRSSLVQELEIVAKVAEGPWRGRVGEGLAGFLRHRQVEGILRILEREMEGFPATGGLARRLDPPQVELDRWYRFRLDFERLRAAGGEDALQTAWYNGLRYVACNWPVDLGKAYPGQAALACREMHLWSARLAVELGDEQISRLSRNNALHVQ